MTVIYDSTMCGFEQGFDLLSFSLLGILGSQPNWLKYEYAGEGRTTRPSAALIFPVTTKDIDASLPSIRPRGST